MIYRGVVDGHRILQRNGQVLLAERAGTGYADGWLNVPGGKLENGETVLDAAIREAREEVGVHVDPRDVRFVTVIHHSNPDGETRVGFFFATDVWQGEPVNAEPHKCARLVWTDPHQLPVNTISYSATGVSQLHNGSAFTLDGWTTSTIGIQ